MLEPRYSSPAVGGGSQASRLLEAASVHNNLDTAVDLSQKSAVAAPSSDVLQDQDQEDSEDEAPLDLKVRMCERKK